MMYDMFFQFSKDKKTNISETIWVKIPQILNLSQIEQSTFGPC